MRMSDADQQELAEARLTRERVAVIERRMLSGTWGPVEWGAASRIWGLPLRGEDSVARLTELAQARIEAVSDRGDVLRDCLASLRRIATKAEDERKYGMAIRAIETLLRATGLLSPEEVRMVVADMRSRVLSTDEIALGLASMVERGVLTSDDLTQVIDRARSRLLPES